MCPRNSRALALFTVALIAVAIDAAPCRPNPSGKPWETKVIYLEFKGCARAEPTEPFELMVGDELVRFHKESPSAPFWRGKATKQFPIVASRKLIVDLVEMRARTACEVAPETYDDGDCVALYTIQCEELWLLSVKPVPPDAQVKIRYERAQLPAVYAACAAEPPIPDGPGEFQLGNESITILVEDLPTGPVRVPLSRTSFRGGRTLVKLRDLAPQAISTNSAVSTNGALKALKKGQLKQVLEDLLFTKD